MGDIPKIRFKGFTGDWEWRKVRDIAPLQRGFDLPTSQMEEGVYPVVMSSGIGGYHSQYKVKGPGIVTGRSGTIGRLHYIEDDYWPHNTTLWVTDFYGNNQKFIYYMYQCLDLSRFSTGSGVPTLNRNDVHDEVVCIPSVGEQKKISDYLTNLDHLITLYQQKCDETKELKKYMLQKMFPQNGKKIPEIRFAGFTGDWEQRKLGELMNVTSVKRIHQSDWTDSGVRFLRARDIVAASKNEEPDDYLYISKEKYEEYSAISGKVDIDDLLVTGVGTIGVPYLVENTEPLYFKDGNIIWFQNQNEIDGKFLYYSFVGNGIQSSIKASAGTGTVGTYTIDTGKKTPIQLPLKDEQKKVGEYFSALDHLITLHQRKQEKLQDIKKFMLQNIFPQEIQENKKLKGYHKK